MREAHRRNEIAIFEGGYNRLKSVNSLSTRATASAGASTRTAASSSRRVRLALGPSTLAGGSCLTVLGGALPLRSSRRAEKTGRALLLICCARRGVFSRKRNRRTLTKLRQAAARRTAARPRRKPGPAASPRGARPEPTSPLPGLQDLSRQASMMTTSHTGWNSGIANPTFWAAESDLHEQGPCPRSRVQRSAPRATPGTTKGGSEAAWAEARPCAAPYSPTGPCPQLSRTFGAWALKS